MNPSQTTSELAYVVAGMSCEHCRVAIADEVSKADGVAGVDTKLVRVHGTGVDGAAVVAAIDETGYDAVAA
jgi:copper chaperone